MADYIIRRAGARDLEAVNALLRQVLLVHHDARPDLFRPEGKKYSDAELLGIFQDPATPVFVYERDGRVLGYAFCILKHISSGCLQDITSLYLDDLCVDENCRGQHIGRTLFEHVREYALSQGCHNITLHAWNGNPAALSFYTSLGLTPQYTSLELLLR